MLLMQCRLPIRQSAAFRLEIAELPQTRQETEGLRYRVPFSIAFHAAEQCDNG